MRKMKVFYLIVSTVAILAMAGCSQNKQNRQKSKADIASVHAQVNELTTSEFKKKIMDYEKHPQEWVFKGKHPVIIDFYATWCQPCKMTALIVEEVAKDYQGKIDFYKVDIDKEQELATIFGIQSIPTFLFIPTKGTPTMQTGAMEKTDFERIIKSVIFK